MGERTIRGAAVAAAACMLWACSDNRQAEAPQANAATSPSSPSPDARSNNRGSDPGTTVMAGDMPDGRAGAPTSPLVDPNFVAADINHILLTGQSNSVANSARP